MPLTGTDELAQPWSRLIDLQLEEMRADAPISTQMTHGLTN